MTSKVSRKGRSFPQTYHLLLIQPIPFYKILALTLKRFLSVNSVDNTLLYKSRIRCDMDPYVTFRTCHAKFVLN